MNVADRANDPDDGIDYDEIIMTTEADFRAGRSIPIASDEELVQFLEEILKRVLEKPVNLRAAS